MSEEFDMLKISILVVEDNLLSQKIVRKFLESEKYTVDLVKTGLEGLAKFKKKHYNFVIMDLGLNGLSGSETALLMRLYEHKKQRTFTPIVGLTVSQQKSDHTKAFFSGITPVFIKPLDEQSKTDILKIIKSMNH